MRRAVAGVALCAASVALVGFGGMLAVEELAARAAVKRATMMLGRDRAYDDPQVHAGATRFLREDAAWVVPATAAQTSVVLHVPASVGAR